MLAHFDLIVTLTMIIKFNSFYRYCECFSHFNAQFLGISAHLNCIVKFTRIVNFLSFYKYYKCYLFSSHFKALFLGNISPKFDFIVRYTIIVIFDFSCRYCKSHLFLARFNVFFWGIFAFLVSSLHSLK